MRVGGVQRHENPCVQWECEMGQLLWKMVVTPQKIKHAITIGFRHSSPGNTPKISENRNSNRYLCTCIPNSITHNSQNVEATQVSINGWMDKQNVVYTYKAILFNLQKPLGIVWNFCLFKSLPIWALRGNLQISMDWLMSFLFNLLISGIIGM